MGRGRIFWIIYKINSLNVLSIFSLFFALTFSYRIWYFSAILFAIYFHNKYLFINGRFFQVAFVSKQQHFSFLRNNLFDLHDPLFFKWSQWTRLGEIKNEDNSVAILTIWGKQRLKSPTTTHIPNQKSDTLVMGKIPLFIPTVYIVEM